MKKIYNSTKNFVTTHKTVIVVGAIATSVILLQRSGLKSVNEFLSEKGLYDEYYTPEGTY